MQTICDELNGSVDGLNVSFDAQTGALNMSTDAMSDHIAKMKESARVTASMERYTQLLKEQAEAEYNLYIAERNRTAAQAAYSENDVGTWGTALKANEAWSQAKLAADDAAAAVADYEGYMADAGITAQSTAAAIDDTADALEASAEAAERVVLGGYDVTDVLESIGMSAVKHPTARYFYRCRDQHVREDQHEVRHFREGYDKEPAAQHAGDGGLGQ